MIKKIISVVKIMVLPIILVVLAPIGCSEDDFLQENPKNAIYSKNIYSNNSGFKRAIIALNGLVAKERGKVTSGNFEAGLMFKIGTDNAGTNTAWSDGRVFGWYDVSLTPSTGTLKKYFDWLYTVVNSTNMCISKAENNDVDWEGATAEESEKNKNYILAHAKLYWAWAYRHLTYTWGDVPLSQLAIDGLTYRSDWNRDSVALIRSEMEKYLLFAEEHLPLQSDDPTVLTKAVARFYLTELYLAMDLPQKAEEKALLVANDAQYSLVTERYGVKQNMPGVAFMDQFYDGNTLRSQGNTGAIWTFITKEDTDGGLGFTTRRGWQTRYDKAGIPISAEYGGRGLALQSLTAYAFSVYDDINDDRFSKYAIRKSWIKKDGSMVLAQMDRSQENKNNYLWSHTRKYDWVSSDPALVAAAYNYNDQVYIRLAELYLLLAEAQMKLNKKGDAVEWINKIRRRAHTYEILASDVTLDFILDERSRELLTEEHRRHTLNRVGKLYERTLKYNKNAAPNIKEFHNLMPIPQSVIDANTGKVMEQNPGY